MQQLFALKSPTGLILCENRNDLVSLTSGLIQSFLDSLQLSLKLLVLHRQPAVSILEQCFQILYPLVASEQFAFRDTSFLLQSRVLVDELFMEKTIQRYRRG